MCCLHLLFSPQMNSIHFIFTTTKDLQFKAPVHHNQTAKSTSLVYRTPFNISMQLGLQKKAKKKKTRHRTISTISANYAHQLCNYNGVFSCFINYKKIPSSLIKRAFFFPPLLPNLKSQMMQSFFRRQKL